MPFISTTTEKFKRKKDQLEFNHSKSTLQSNNPIQYMITAIESKLTPIDKHYTLFQAILALTKVNLNLYEQIIAPCTLELHEYTLKVLKSKKSHLKEQRKQILPTGKKKSVDPFSSILRHLAKTQLVALSLLDGEYSHEDQYKNFSAYSEQDIISSLKSDRLITDVNLIDGLMRYRRLYAIYLPQALQLEKNLNQLIINHSEIYPEFQARWEAIKKLMEEEGNAILAKKTIAQNRPSTLLGALFNDALATIVREKEVAFNTKLNDLFDDTYKKGLTTAQSSTSDKKATSSTEEVYELAPPRKKYQ